MRALNEEFAHERTLKLIDRIRAEKNIALVAVVGLGMQGRPGIAARTFGALSREGEATHKVIADLAANRDLPGACDTTSFLTKTLRSPEAEASARAAVERLALLAAGAALNESAPSIAETFARARLAEPAGPTYGTARLTGDEVARLLDRALPAD